MSEAKSGTVLESSRISLRSSGLRRQHNPSYAAKAGYPVRRGLSIQSCASLGYWITRMRGWWRPNMRLRSRDASRPRFLSSFALQW